MKNEATDDHTTPFKNIGKSEHRMISLSKIIAYFVGSTAVIVAIVQIIGLLFGNNILMRIIDTVKPDSSLSIRQRLGSESWGNEGPDVYDVYVLSEKVRYYGFNPFHIIDDDKLFIPIAELDITNKGLFDQSIRGIKVDVMGIHPLSVVRTALTLSGDGAGGGIEFQHYAVTEVIDNIGTYNAKYQGESGGIEYTSEGSKPSRTGYVRINPTQEEIILVYANFGSEGIYDLSISIDFTGAGVRMMKPFSILVLKHSTFESSIISSSMLELSRDIDNSACLEYYIFELFECYETGKALITLDEYLEEQAND